MMSSGDCRHGIGLGCQTSTPYHQTLIMDEAGQYIEPLAWCVFPLADKYILAGDHYQLPPTVLSYEAMQRGLNQSILEVAILVQATNPFARYPISNETLHRRIQQSIFLRIFAENGEPFDRRWCSHYICRYCRSRNE